MALTTIRIFDAIPSCIPARFNEASIDQKQKPGHETGLLIV
jgi:hypothetical protein